MRYARILAAMALLLGLAACFGKPNPLIGKWGATMGACTVSQLEFTNTTETGTNPGFGPYPGNSATVQVTYNVQQYSVGVTTPMGMQTFNIINPEQIFDTSTACIYRKTG